MFFCTNNANRKKNYFSKPHEDRSQWIENEKRKCLRQLVFSAHSIFCSCRLGSCIHLIIQRHTFSSSSFCRFFFFFLISFFVEWRRKAWCCFINNRRCAAWSNALRCFNCWQNFFSLFALSLPLRLILSIRSSLFFCNFSSSLPRLSCPTQDWSKCLLIFMRSVSKRF